MEVSQRWLSFLRGEDTDRIPVFPTIMGHCAKITGAENLGDYYSKPKVFVESNIIAREMYGYDQPPIIIDPGYGCAVWGGKTMLPYNPKMGAPTPVQPAALTVDEFEKLEIPDPKTAPYMKEFREMLRLCVEKKQMPYVWISGGFITNTAPMIVPVEDFMMWLIEDPKLAHKALEMSAEFGIRLAESFVDEFGSDTWYAFQPNPTDSNVLIDEGTFAEYPLKHVIRLNKKMADMGLSTWIHWCADHNANIDAGHVAKIPVGEEGFINFGPEVTMADQVDKLSDKFRLVGNINPPRMMTESYSEWVNTCKQNIEEGKEAKLGYALGVGCEVPPPSPPSNMFGLVQAAKEYGKI